MWQKCHTLKALDRRPSPDYLLETNNGVKQMTGLLVFSLLLIGPASHAIFSRMPEAPEPQEPSSAPPEYFGPSRRLFEIDRALA